MIQPEITVTGIDEIQKMVNLRIKHLGETPRYAVTAAMINVLKSLRARTRTGQARRKVTQEKIAIINLSKGTRRNRKIKDSYVMERWGRDGMPERVPIFARSLAEAKLSAPTNIRFRGLAKSSWGWAMQQIGTKAPGSMFISNAQVCARNMSVISTVAKNEYILTVANELDFISKAFHGGNASSILNQAMLAASRKMKGDILRRLGMAKGDAFPS